MQATRPASRAQAISTVSRTTATSRTRDSTVAAAVGTPARAAAASKAAGSILQALVTGRSSRRPARRDSDNRYERPPQPM
ncbi:hypothetical protein [Amycolatopsis sp. cg9]|uniref:hypothetical protein n=1 Tax=Amycolatopsis sp. cg9 TaxID=3238801 RepID=UPI003525BC52